MTHPDDMAGDAQPELPLDLQADYGWFHIMKPRLVKGLIGEIGETAWAVYTIIKAHAHHTSGRADPSQERIGELIGKGTETVSRATKVLIAHGLIKETKKGRHKEYQLLESAPLTDRMSGSPEGSVDFAYVPQAFAAQLQALRAFIREGAALGSGLTLNLTVNLIQQRDGGVVNLQTVQMAPELSSRPDLQELGRRLRRLGI